MPLSSGGPVYLERSVLHAEHYCQGGQGPPDRDPGPDIDREHVVRLATTLRNGGYLPPPLAKKTANGYEIFTGMHTFLAHVEVRQETIELEVTETPLKPGEIKLDQWREIKTASASACLTRPSSCWRS